MHQGPWFRVEKILVRAIDSWIPALTVNIQDSVLTDVPQFAASVGSVGPVTLKNNPIDIVAPTIAAIKSLVAHFGLNITDIGGHVYEQRKTNDWIRISIFQTDKASVSVRVTTQLNDRTRIVEWVFTVLLKFSKIFFLVKNESNAHDRIDKKNFYLHNKSLFWNIRMKHCPRNFRTENTFQIQRLEVI